MIDRNSGGVVIGAQSFRLVVSGELKILEVIKFNASVTVLVGGGQVTVGSGDTQASFFLNPGEWAFAV